MTETTCGPQTLMYLLLQFFTEEFAQSWSRTVKSHILLYWQTDELIWDSFVDDDKLIHEISGSEMKGFITGSSSQSISVFALVF